MSFIVDEITFVMISIGPEILSLSVQPIIFEFSSINLAVFITICAMPIFSKIGKLTLVSLLSFHEDSKSLYFIVFPLTYIRYFPLSFPLTTSVLFIVKPLSIVNLSIGPLKAPFTIFLVIFEMAKEE